MLSQAKRHPGGARTPEGLARCRATRLMHGHFTAQAHALRRAWREYRRAYLAAEKAVRRGNAQAEDLVAEVSQKAAALVGVLGAGATPHQQGKAA